MNAQSYSPKEMMTIMAAREINDGDVVFAGTGISMLAATAAKLISAPHAVIFFETGAMDSAIEDLPMAVADPRVMYGAASNTGLLDAFSFMQNPITGNRVIAILGAAQIDRYGNLNSTVIGDYDSPDTRFSGSGGACDVASFVPRCIAFMMHEKRRFVKKVDYLTSPGQRQNNRTRDENGLRPGGVNIVITDKGVLRIDTGSGELYLDRYYPGIAVEDILDNMQFGVDTSRARAADPPTGFELATLREKCDPQRLIL